MPGGFYNFNNYSPVTRGRSSRRTFVADPRGILEAQGTRLAGDPLGGMFLSPDVPYNSALGTFNLNTNALPRMPLGGGYRGASTSRNAGMVGGKGVPGTMSAGSGFSDTARDKIVYDPTGRSGVEPRLLSPALTTQQPNDAPIAGGLPGGGKRDFGPNAGDIQAQRDAATRRGVQDQLGDARQSQLDAYTRWANMGLLGEGGIANIESQIRPEENYAIGALQGNFQSQQLLNRQRADRMLQGNTNGLTPGGRAGLSRGINADLAAQQTAGGMDIQNQINNIRLNRGNRTAGLVEGDLKSRAMGLQGVGSTLDAISGQNRTGFGTALEDQTALANTSAQNNLMLQDDAQANARAMQYAQFQQQQYMQYLQAFYQQQLMDNAKKKNGWDILGGALDIAAPIIGFAIGGPAGAAAGSAVAGQDDQRWY